MKGKILASVLVLFLCGGVVMGKADKLVLKYYGQSCFSLGGTFAGILFDPFGKAMKYTLPQQRFGIVLVSHEHFDHNNVDGVAGFPVILHGLKDAGKAHANIDFSIGDAHIIGIPTEHDRERGSLRGLNTIFLVDFAGFRIAHLGDLGRPLTDDEIKQLHHLDVLLIPVGGFYTITPEEAADIVKKLNPVVAVPMHYKTEATSEMPIQPVEAFLKYFPDAVRVKGSTLTFDRKKPFEKPGVYVLEPAK